MSATSKRLIEGLRLCVFLLCVVGFLFLSWEQVDNFFRGSTSTSQTWEHVEARKFPVLVFCKYNGYSKSEVKMDTEASYQSALTNLSVELKGLVINDYLFDPLNSEDFESSTIFTYYHGRCERFKIKKAIPAWQTLAFALPAGEHALLYLIEEGEEFFLSYGSMLNSVILMEIAESKFIKITASSFNQLESATGCKSYSPKHFFLDCFQPDMRRLVKEKEVKCIAAPFRSFLEIPHDCQSEEDMWHGLSAVWARVSETFEHSATSGEEKENGEVAACRKPCRIQKYDLEVIPYPNFDEEVHGRITYVTFSSNYDLRNDQYYVYNFGRVTAAIGGALGLFLGISFFSVISDLIHFFDVSGESKESRVKSQLRFVKEMKSDVGQAVKTNTTIPVYNINL